MTARRGDFLALPVPPAIQILLAGDRLQMRDVRAGPVAAQVIQVHTLWNWPGKQLVHHAMHHLLSAVPSDHAIAIVLGPRPFQAVGAGIDDQTGQEPFAESAYPEGIMNRCGVIEAGSTT